MGPQMQQNEHVRDTKPVTNVTWKNNVKTSNDSVKYAVDFMKMLSEFKSS